MGRQSIEQMRATNARIIGMIGNLDDNPRIAEVLGICCAYEVYMKVDPKVGYANGKNGYLVILRADGPTRTLYVQSWEAPTHAAAVRLACELGCREVADETGEELFAPLPLEEIKYDVNPDDDSLARWARDIEMGE